MSLCPLFAKSTKNIQKEVSLMADDKFPKNQYIYLKGTVSLEKFKYGSNLFNIKCNCVLQFFIDHYYKE